MQDKLDELHYIYKIIGNYGFCTVQELLDKYNKQKEVIDKAVTQIEHVRQYFDESLQADFVLIEDILKEVQE